MLDTDGLRSLVAHLTEELHTANRRLIYEHSGQISTDLRALRAEIDAMRYEAGLHPSPVAPVFDGEEDPEEEF